MQLPGAEALTELLARRLSVSVSVSVEEGEADSATAAALNRLTDMVKLTLMRVFVAENNFSSPLLQTLTLILV